MLINYCFSVKGVLLLLLSVAMISHTSSHPVDDAKKDEDVSPLKNEENLQNIEDKPADADKKEPDAAQAEADKKEEANKTPDEANKAPEEPNKAPDEPNKAPEEPSKAPEAANTPGAKEALQETDKTADEATTPGEATTKADDKAAEGETTAQDSTNDVAATAPTEPGNNAETDTTQPEQPAEGVSLTMPIDATTPKNIFTNRYGEPVKDGEIMNITLPNGGYMQIYTEKWMTYYTQPATKPGCLCLTRGPLPKFKLIGNIHFPKIKVTPERYVTLPTEPSSTVCPPCICNCGVTPPIDFVK